MYKGVPAGDSVISLEFYFKNFDVPKSITFIGGWSPFEFIFLSKTTF